MKKTKELKVGCVYLFANGMLTVFDTNYEQVGELQGKYTRELHEKILARSTDQTEWNGLNKNL